MGLGPHLLKYRGIGEPYCFHILSCICLNWNSTYSINFFVQESKQAFFFKDVFQGVDKNIGVKVIVVGVWALLSISSWEWNLMFTLWLILSNLLEDVFCEGWHSTVHEMASGWNCLAKSCCTLNCHIYTLGVGMSGVC